MEDRKFKRYVLLLRGSKKTPKALIQRHVAYLEKLEKQKQLVMAGPFAEKNSGMVIYKAKDANEAINIALDDPFVLEGYRDWEMLPWTLSCKENNHLGFGSQTT